MNKGLIYLVLMVLLNIPSQAKTECLYSSGGESSSSINASLTSFQKIVELVKNERLNFNSTQERRVEAVVSLFENSELAPVYDYIEDIKDGRGFTAGKIGFTTGTGDLLLVVKEYLKLNPSADPEWKKLLPSLQEKSDH